jgi:hypothetical protein
MSAEAIARAVLYEGYSLYPYRPTSLKNQRRVLFGTLLPRVWVEANPESNDAWRASTECLLQHEAPKVEASARFLRLDREPPAEDSCSVDAEITQVAPGLVRVSASIENLSDIDPRCSREEAERFGLGAAHIVLRASGGGWVSAIDPPGDLACHECNQSGLWPVLAGPDAMLAAPIILYDQPAIAKESAGDLFDATEIEEILALRVRTLTDAEKAELRHDAVTRALLERVEAMTPSELAGLHGTFRRPKFAVGDSVTIRPSHRADALDVLLRGYSATVVSIETTLEGEELICVTIDRDPGRDLGERGFPGHRFFFRPDELSR